MSMGKRMLTSKLSDNITIILPVYSGFKQVKECVDSVLRSSNERNWRLLIVYDCGPDPDVEEYMDSCVCHDNVSLVKNSSNLGFVQSVNKAAKICESDDIILLNADTVVPAGWIDRMCSVAEQSSDIGTVTPMSNNAEAFSFPLANGRNDIPHQYSVEMMSHALYKANPLLPVDVPTGVGFCMLVRRAAINSTGFFDEKAFGRGYGEENDFCRRIIKNGYRNVVCPALWVYHEGNVSFGDERAELVAQHMEIIQRRYPDYLPTLNRFVRDDPLAAFRLQGILQLLADDELPVVLGICHGLGGGTAKNMFELASHHKSRFVFVYLEPVDDKQLALNFPSWAWPFPLIFNRYNDLELLLEILVSIQISRIHIHHIKGLEQLVPKIVQVLGVDYIITLHDYYFISSNPTLTDENGKFNQERLDSPNCIQEDLKRGVGFTPLEWRRYTEDLLYGASHVIAPSSWVRTFYNKRYPDLDMALVEHLDAELYGKYPSVCVRARGGDDRVVILALGALGKEKGADLLERVARLAQHRMPRFQFQLLGYTYRPLSKAVVTHGAYNDKDLKSLIEKLNPDVIWFPCLWPETYSYTLSTVLELGLPIVVPKLGALYTRTIGRPLSMHVDHDACPEIWLQALNNFVASVDRHRGSKVAWDQQNTNSTFYDKLYPSIISSTLNESRGMEMPDFLALKDLLARQPHAQESVGEKIVSRLIMLRNLPGVRRITSLIPISQQRKIKRFLVRRPLHEVKSMSKVKINQG